MSQQSTSGKIGHPSNKRPRSPSSLEEQLSRQIKYLSRSALLFDSGHEDEAPRLATSLRVLLHDTDKSQSLLKQLGIKHAICYVDTGLYRERLDAAKAEWAKTISSGCQVVAIRPGEAGLVVQGSDSRGFPSWVAPLATPRLSSGHPCKQALLSHQAFDPWWTTPLVEGSNLRRFSRKNLVLIMANQDGGAHVAPGLDSDYEELCVDFLGSQWAEGDQVDNPDASVFKNVGGNVAAASVRQITHELLRSLEAHLHPKTD